MVQKKTTTKPVRKRTKKSRAHLVDYYPNKMTFAISVLGGTTLVLLALLAALTINNG